MAYIGAESPSDWLLHDIRKGTRSDQTLAAVEQCRSHGVVPELSFMLAPPQDPEGETERTFEFIRMIKRLHPATEVMIYIYTPLPLRQRQYQPAAAARCEREMRDCDGSPVVFPRTAPMAGPSRTGWLTGATRMRPGCLRGCDGASSISRRCWVVDSRPSWTSAPLPGARRRCGHWRPGAIAFSATTIPGSCASRGSSSANGTRG